ncbi:MAG TPA: DUF4412 domain-containing protein [Verrucomicrobiae bacterium]|jgi:hypothetical protein|nr:DUF4412 domain-containing protein [Verrucomicrobiae bacterium]
MIYDRGFRCPAKITALGLLLLTLNSHLSQAFAFEGRITAALTQSGQVTLVLYTVDTHFLRVENTATNWPNPVDILNRGTGELTLLFPHNRKFTRIKNAVSGTPEGTPPAMPAMRPGIGPQGMPSGSLMPAMGAPSMDHIELQPTGETTNILGFDCTLYLIKQSHETMEIWATDKLPAFQPYVQRQPRGNGPHSVADQWGDYVKAKQLFPLLAVLKTENGLERFRFEVKSIAPQKLTEEDAPLFQPPPDYVELQQLPFLENH